YPQDSMKGFSVVSLHRFPLSQAWPGARTSSVYFPKPEEKPRAPGHLVLDHITQPRRAASIAAMSIFFICIIASNPRWAAARSGSLIACVSAIGVSCQDSPHLSLHQPHALSLPPLSTIAFQYRSVSAWSAVAT